MVLSVSFWDKKEHLGLISHHHFYRDSEIKVICAKNERGGLGSGSLDSYRRNVTG